MNILITICARGGSKGIPGKNIKPINGMPLIAMTIKTAQNFAQKKPVHIGLSTDSQEIRETAAKFGLTTNYVRPTELATDKAGKIGTIEDLVIFEEKEKNTRFDYVLDLDVTSPLRTQEDLDKAFEMLVEDPEAWNIFSVNPANRNPYFNMVEKKENGYFDVIKKQNQSFLSRQSTPAVYDMNASFYFFRRSYFDAGINSSVTDKSLIYLMPHLCFDLDEPIDYDFLSFLIKENKLEFELGI